MTGKHYRTTRLLWQTCVLVVALMALTGCGTEIAPWLPQTTVTPLPGEDLSQPCVYSLLLATGPPATPGGVPTAIPQRGVVVIYQRTDSFTLFSDPDVQKMASQLNMAMMFADQCNAASYPDIQVDASKGPGRALFQALTQFATMTDHPELANANVILSGFSAAGYLSVTMANNYPTRVLGALPDAPATAYFDLDDLQVTPGGSKVPMLIMAGGNDTSAGTYKPQQLFDRGWAMGGTWGFAVQHSTPHCCTDSVKSLMIPWVNAVMQKNTATAAMGLAVPQPLSAPAAPTVRFACIPDDYFDVFGWPTCDFVSASILPSTTGGPEMGWLPDQTTANAWLAWVTNPSMN